mgnify:CR=1 FL=1|jgi:hypothetical protein
MKVKILVIRFDYTILIDNQEKESDNEESYLYDVVNMTEDDAAVMFDTICERAYISGDEVFGSYYPAVIEVDVVEGVQHDQS